MFYESNQDIINKLSIKHRVNNQIVEECISHVFKEIKNKMAGDDYPNILIHGWGRFKPSLAYMKYKIRYLYKYIQETEVDETNAHTRLTHLIKAYDRLCIEEKKILFKEFNTIKEYINNYNEQESKTSK